MFFVFLEGWDAEPVEDQGRVDDGSGEAPLGCGDVGPRVFRSPVGLCRIGGGAEQASEDPTVARVGGRGSGPRWGDLSGF